MQYFVCILSAMVNPQSGSAFYFLMISSIISSKTKISYAEILRSAVKAKHSLKSIQANLQCFYLFLPISKKCSQQLKKMFCHNAAALSTKSHGSA